MHPIYELLPRESSTRPTACLWMALFLAASFFSGCQDAQSPHPLEGRFTGLFVSGTSTQPPAFIPCTARTQRWYVTGDSLSFQPGDAPYSKVRTPTDSLLAFSAGLDSVFDTRATLSAQQQLTIDRTVKLPTPYRPSTRSFSPDTLYRMTIAGYTSNRTNIPSSVGLFQRVLVVDTLYDVRPNEDCPSLSAYGL